MMPYVYLEALLPSVSSSSEIEVQLQYSTVKGAPETTALTFGPFLVYYSECNIFIRWASRKMDDAEILIVSGCEMVCWRDLGVDQIRVKYVKFVALDNLWRWIVCVIMCAIITTPIIARAYPIEIFWFSRCIFVGPW